MNDGSGSTLPSMRPATFVVIALLLAAIVLAATIQLLMAL